MNSIPSASIVVAADGSPAADRAVQWAAEQAALERRRLAVVTVAAPVHPLAAAGVGAAYVYPTEDLLEQAGDVARSAAELALRHRPGIEVESVPLSGDPTSVLEGLSEDAHLLVLGSRGRGGVRSKALGSVGASVSRHASCPVVVARPGTDLKVKHGVLVGADATPESLPVLDFAFRQAALRSLPLTVLHSHQDALAAVGGPRIGFEGEFDLEASRLALAESVTGFGEQHPDVHATIRTAHGAAADSLAAAADRHNLVVIGRHPVASLARRVSTTTATSVLERCHTTVAVVPEDGAP